MAKRSSSPAAVLLAAIALVAAARPLAACPFCTELKPSLCQWRDSAAVAALAEVLADSPEKRTRLRLHRVLKGAERLGTQDSLEIALDVAARPGALLLIFGSGAADVPPAKLNWHAVAVDETSYGYFGRAPSLKTPIVERLRYFAPFLEHADPLIAQDAYLEFGHARFDEVARVADRLPMARMRLWLADPRVPQDRKGFYGLAVGLGVTPDERSAGADFLRRLIVAPDDDFRAGFDGILGGYLLLSGVPGLEMIESRYLANARAADGDVRHALTALRFYHEYGREIPVERLRGALGHLLNRPEFAEAAITDLARWNDWGSLERVAGLYAKSGYDQPATRRAVVGYLLACPAAKAAQELARLRERDPAGVAAAEQVLSRTTSVPGAEQ
jgi:hypothetical protein